MNVEIRLPVISENLAKALMEVLKPKYPATALGYRPHNLGSMALPKICLT